MEKYNSLATEVLNLAETKLLAQLRFLSGAVMAMGKEETEQDILFASDGKKIYFHAENVLKEFQKEKNRIAAAMLHVLLHCLMGHPFYLRKDPSGQKAERDIWNVACDMAVEGARIELSKEFLKIDGDDIRKNQLSRIKDYAGADTAQAYYNYFIDYAVPKEEFEELKELFHRDDHNLWIKEKNRQKGVEKNISGQTEKSEDESEDEDEINTILTTDEKITEVKNSKQKERWKKIAEQVRTDLEIFNRRQGIHAGSLMNNMKQILFEEVDYSEFLKIFGSENEVTKLSEDEFDLVYYTYGLELYHNIPLIEPMEFCDDNRIREFVIAIDTSGSVQGEIVQDFLRRTCQILKQTNSFAQQVNIYILQCDSIVQNCTRLTDLDELEDYIKNLTLYGFGGTDFRPVFDYVEQLQNEKKLQKINGLLYFTDGIGIYPAKEPKYKTAFIFCRDDYISPNVPEWAIKAVLTSDNIKMMKERS